MKKLLVLALTFLLLLTGASTSLAGTLYFDMLTDGEAEFEDGGVPGGFDLSQRTLGCDIELGKFKIAGSYGTGTIEVNNFRYSNTSLFTVKGSYALLDSEKHHLDITGGYYQREFNCTGYLFDFTLTSLTLGFDDQLYLGDKIWFDLNLGIGIQPKFEYFGTNPESGNYETEKGDFKSFTVAELKFNYLFTKQLGAALGYHWERWKVTVGEQDTVSGLTLRAFYKFHSQPLSADM